MTKVIHIADEETGALAGVSESSSRPAWAETSNVIPFPTPLPPPWAGEDEDAGCWESLGVLAVRIVGQFDRPRILVWSSPEDLGGVDSPPET